ncbi:MAG: cupin-like domain-containing protein [Candidatus Binatia bacterium]
MKPSNITSAQWLEYNALFLAEHFLGRRRFLEMLGERAANLTAAIDHQATGQDALPDLQVIEEEGEFSEPLYHPHHVKVLRGAAKDWPCTREWSFDYFAERYGDMSIQLYNNVGLVGNSQQDFDTTRLRDYIAELKEGSRKYLKFSRIANDDSALKDDFDHEWLSKFTPSGSFGKIFYLFMGAAGTLTPIHNGMPPTLFVQVVGQKRWLFYPPSHRLFLGVRAERRNYFYSDVDPFAARNDGYPIFQHSKPHEVILNPGDLLWFPSYVWHHVENLTASIGVAYKYVHLPSAFKASKMMATLFFLSTRPFLLESFISSRIKKNDRIFTNPPAPSTSY